MGVYKRGDVCWISYAGPHGLVRETTEQGDVRVAARIERERRREVALGTWRPRSSRVGELATVSSYGEIWLARLEERGVRTIRSYRQRFRDHVEPVLGKRVLADLRPRDVIAFIDSLKAQMRDGKLAPRTIHHVYDCLRSLCRDAVVDEVLIATPCVLLPKTLPKKRDKDPNWRARAVYTREELEMLISSDLIAEDRRVYYALLFLLGGRAGEAVGRRWEDWDPAARPLGRMLITTQGDGAELKTQAPREMPVHPTLAAVLARWKLEGWARWFGRAPKPRDFIVPNRRGAEYHRLVETCWQGLQDDLSRLDLRRRRQHDTRRTFVSLARIDGGRPDVLETCTHAASGEQFDMYTTFDWATKCAEVAKLRVGLRGGAPIGEVHGQVHSASSGGAKVAAIVDDSLVPGEGLEPARSITSAVDSRAVSAGERPRRPVRPRAK